MGFTDTDAFERLMDLLLGAYVVSAPIYFLRLGTNVVPTDFIGAAFITLWAFSKLRNHTTVRFTRLLASTAVLAVFSIGSTIYSPYPLEAFPSGALFLNLVVVSVATYDWIISTDRSFTYVYWLLKLWIVGAVAATLIMLGMVASEVGIKVIKPAYSYAHRTQLPYLLVITGIASVFLFKHASDYEKIQLKVASFVLYQFSTFVLFISISRGPWVAVTSVLSLVFLFYPACRRHIISLNIIGLAGSFIVAIYFNQVYRIRSRLISIFKPGDSETIGRIRIYTNALETAFDNPLFGIGWNNYSVVFNISGSAHSTYLTIATELGLVVLAAYVLIPAALSVFWMRLVTNDDSVVKKRKDIVLAMVTGLLGLLVGQVFSTAIFWYRAYWVLLGMTLAAYSLKRTS